MRQLVWTIFANLLFGAYVVLKWLLLICLLPAALFVEKVVNPCAEALARAEPRLIKRARPILEHVAGSHRVSSVATRLRQVALRVTVALAFVCLTAIFVYWVVPALPDDMQQQISRLYALLVGLAVVMPLTVLIVPARLVIEIAGSGSRHRREIAIRQLQGHSAGDTAVPVGVAVQEPRDLRREGRRTILTASATALGGLCMLVVCATLGLTLLGWTPGGIHLAPQADMLEKYKSSWVTGTTCFFRPDGYHVIHAGTCTYHAGVYTDCKLDVDATVTRDRNASGFYGVALRVVDPADLYEFELGANGALRFARYDAGRFVLLWYSASESAVRTGMHESNHLEVDARGAEFTLIVNSIQVAQVEDDTFTSGRIGLTGDNGLEVVYSGLQLK